MEAFVCRSCSLTMGDEGRLPKVLGCGHTLCSFCASRLVVQSFIECPVCKVNFYTGSADEIPINHMVNSILESPYAEHLVAIANIIKEYDDQEPGQAASQSTDDVPAKSSCTARPSGSGQSQSTKERDSSSHPQAAAEACISKESTGSDPLNLIDPDKTQSLEGPHKFKIIKVNVPQKEVPKCGHLQLASSSKTTSKQTGIRSRPHREKQIDILKRSIQSKTSEQGTSQESSEQLPPKASADPPSTSGSGKPDAFEEPDYHAGKCESHQKYKTFYCIRCIQWTCFSCIKMYHPQKTCITTTLRQGRELMRHLESEEISRILKEFEVDVKFLRQRNRIVRNLICQFKKLILELRILLNHCEKSESKLVLEVFEMNSVIADGLDSLFMLLTAQRILLDDTYAEEMIGKTRSVDDYRRIRQQWFGPRYFENSLVIKHAMELQKALEASLRVFRGYQEAFVYGNFSFNPPEKARETLIVLAAQILGGSRGSTVGNTGDKSAASAAGSTTETASTPGSTTGTLSAAGSISDIASAVSKETPSTTESTSSRSKNVEESVGESQISEVSLPVSKSEQPSSKPSQSIGTSYKETSQTSGSTGSPAGLPDLFQGIKDEVIFGDNTPTEDEQESITSDVVSPDFPADGGN
ncbi:uncharacterized protein [Macrobrachium rosenbergii]|uniref:uncharacterized protein n=1 Tax=Macrobrachium rosenbergii TaxID=79674 RepID=UPI0034D7527F